MLFKTKNVFNNLLSLKSFLNNKQTITILFSKLLFSGSLVIIAVLTCLFTFHIGQNLCVYKQHRNKQLRLQYQCTLANQECHERKAYLKHLTEDREFLERVVRQQLEYTKPNELVFKFFKATALN